MTREELLATIGHLESRETWLREQAEKKARMSKRLREEYSREANEASALITKFRAMIWERICLFERKFRDLIIAASAPVPTGAPTQADAVSNHPMWGLIVSLLYQICTDTGADLPDVAYILTQKMEKNEI